MGVVVPLDYGALMASYPQFGSAVPSAVFSGSIADSVLSVSSFTSGSLVVGSLLSGQNADVRLGTYVTSVVTPGSVFNVNYPQTAPSEVMTATIGQLTLQQAQAFFAEAGIYHANNGEGPITDPVQQSFLLNLVVAHLATMYLTVNGQAPSGLVGRVSQASEGPFSLSVDFDAPPGTAQWWMQTKPGSDYWVATAPYRTFRWRRGPGPRNMNPWFGGYYRPQW